MRHLGDIVGEDTGGIDHDGRVDGPPVGVDRSDGPTIGVHGEDRRVEAQFDAVLRRVFRVGDRQVVRRDDAGGGVVHREREVRVHGRVVPQELLLPHDLHVGDAVMVLAPEREQRDRRSQITLREAGVLADAPERDVQVGADSVIHMVAFEHILLLEAPFAEVDARVDFPVVAAGGLQGKVGFFFHEQDVEVPLREFPGDGRPGDAAADDEHVDVFPVESVIADGRDTHRNGLRPFQRDIVHDVDTPFVFGNRHVAGFQDVFPCRETPGDTDGVPFPDGRHSIAEGLVQFSLDTSDLIHSRQRFHLLPSSRSFDRLSTFIII